MIPVAVSPIAVPIRTRRRKGSAMAWWAGEPGYSRIVPKMPAEIMKMPSPAASITYSGQWRLKASSMRPLHRLVAIQLVLGHVHEDLDGVLLFDQESHHFLIVVQAVYRMRE